MSVGIESTKCCPPKGKEYIDAKKATIIFFRKYAKDIGEPRYITNIKIKAIQNHDMSKGSIVQCDSETRIYTFSIEK